MLKSLHQTMEEILGIIEYKGDTKAFAMDIGIPTDVGNGIQGDQVTLTVTFTINQHASQ